MATDYPAAHSMDTRWFAIDRDGHVASFYSGEDGAVPSAAFTDEGDDLWSWVEQHVPLGEVVYDLQGRVLPGTEAKSVHQAYTGREAVVLFLSSLDPVAKAIKDKKAVQVPATEGFAVMFRQMTDKELHRLQNLPECLGSFHLYGFNDGGQASTTASHGVFEYDNLEGGWGAGPYGREALPRRPIHVDELPPKLRQMVSRVQFDLSFAETPHLQPAEHMECEAWGSCYLDSTGKHTRAIPGKEQEYREHYDELAEYVTEGGYEAEPPPEE